MSKEANSLIIRRILKASPEQVWQAWSVPDHLAKWWAPAPVKTRVIALELRNGGAFNTEMTLPDGTVMGGEACFLDVITKQRIVFTDALQGGWRPNKDTFMTAIIDFTPHPDGTDYCARVLHADEADQKKHEEMGFLDGWGTALSQLEAVASRL